MKLTRMFYIIMFKVILVLALIPVVFFCLYLLPILVVEAFTGVNNLEVLDILTIISVFVISCFYCFGIFYSFKLLTVYKNKDYLTSDFFKFLKNIINSILGIVFIMIIDLPIVYLHADRTDAPGIILFFIILLGIVLSVWVFLNLLFKMNLDINEKL